MKATRDDGTKDLIHADLPPTFPNLSVKGVRTSPSSGSTSLDRKFNELVSLCTLCYEIAAVVLHYIFAHYSLTFLLCCIS